MDWNTAVVQHRQHLGTLHGVDTTMVWSIHLPRSPIPSDGTVLAREYLGGGG